MYIIVCVGEPELREHHGALCLHSHSLLASWQYVYIIVTFTSSEQDEPKNLEDLPEYQQKMRGDRVMGINYSFLWQHLEPSRLLPKLVDKELVTETGKQEAQLYKQKFAQNAVIINEFFGAHCSPIKLCDTLDVTGQEHIARKLLQGTHCVGTIFILIRNWIVFCTGIRGQQSMQFFLNNYNPLFKSTYMHKFPDFCVCTYAHAKRTCIHACTSPHTHMHTNIHTETCPAQWLTLHNI